MIPQALSLMFAGISCLMRTGHTWSVTSIVLSLNIQRILFCFPELGTLRDSGFGIEY